jgi:hypothetical protein
MSKAKSVNGRVNFEATMSRSVVFEIDKVRGDTNRTLWLERLAIRELQRVKKNRQGQEEESKGASGSRSTNLESEPTDTADAPFRVKPRKPHMLQGMVETRRLPDS